MVRVSVWVWVRVRVRVRVVVRVFHAYISASFERRKLEKYKRIGLLTLRLHMFR